MTEHEVFETRLRTALAVHVAGGPTDDFDAHGFARAVAEAEPRRHGRTIALRGPRVVIPRIAWVVVAAVLLIAALAASALFGGARPFVGPSTWQRIVLPAPAGSPGWMADVVQAGSGYLAVGSTCTHCGGDMAGIVWTSRDGLAWDLVDTGDTFAHAELSAVIAGDGGFVVVGSNWLGATNPNGSGATRAAAWVSADGRTWRRAASVAAPEGARIGDVAFARGRYVAVGWELPSSGGYLIPRIWQSDDADHWVPATDFAAAPSFLGVMTGVVAGGPGFVAVGHDHGIWTSPDGNSWSTGLEWTAHDMAIAAGRDGLIVVGASLGGHDGTRTSGDGRTWTSAALPALDGSPAIGSGLEPGSIVASDWGFVVVSTWSSDQRWGYHEGDPIEGGLWTSRDGISWVPHRLNPQFAATLRGGLLIRSGDAILVSTDAGTWALPGAAVSEAAIP